MEWPAGEKQPWLLFAYLTCSHTLVSVNELPMQRVNDFRFSNPCPFLQYSVDHVEKKAGLPALWNRAIQTDSLLIDLFKGIKCTHPKRSLGHVDSFALLLLFCFVF